PTRFPFPVAPFPSSYSPLMPAYARRAPEEPDQRSERHDRRRLLAREERRVEEPAFDQLVGGERQPDCDQSPQHALDRSLEQEGAPDEAVGGANQAHDGDLPAPLQHR